MNDQENPEDIKEEIMYPYWNLIHPTAEKVLYLIFFASWIILTIISFKI